MARKKKKLTRYDKKLMKKGRKEEKVADVMEEFKEGELKSGRSKKKVKNRKQALAIALSEAGIKKKKKKRK